MIHLRNEKPECPPDNKYEGHQPHQNQDVGHHKMIHLAVGCSQKLESQLLSLHQKLIS